VLEDCVGGDGGAVRKEREERDFERKGAAPMPSRNVLGRALPLREGRAGPARSRERRGGSGGRKGKRRGGSTSIFVILVRPLYLVTYSP